MVRFPVVPNRLGVAQVNDPRAGGPSSRLHLKPFADIESECWPALSRNPRPDWVGIRSAAQARAIRPAIDQPMMTANRAASPRSAVRQQPQYISSRMCEGQTFEFLPAATKAQIGAPSSDGHHTGDRRRLPQWHGALRRLPRNEGGPQPPAPPLLETASPYDRSGSGWGQNALGARSASSDETLRLARWQGPSPRPFARLWAR